MGDGGYKIRDKEGIHFITFAVTEWVDVFTRRASFRRKSPITKAPTLPCRCSAWVMGVGSDSAAAGCN